jgi:hypothetical protein
MPRRVLIGIVLVLTCVGLLGLYYRPWELRGPISYLQLRLGMTEDDVERILLGRGREYRPVRRFGGMFSPGKIEVPLAETGLPRANLPKRDDAPGDVVVRQWWGVSYGIDVAFDKNGRAAGIYLCKLKSIGW